MTMASKTAAAVAFVALAAAEPEREARQRGDRRGDGGGDGADQNVAMQHVAQFVRDHAFELAVVHQLQNARGERDRGVVRIAAGGEGVGRRLRRDVELRHGNVPCAGPDSRPAARCGRRLRRGFRRQRLRSAHRKRDLIGEEIAGEIHRHGDDEAVFDAPVACQSATPDHQDRAQQAQQGSGFQVALLLMCSAICSYSSDG